MIIDMKRFKENPDEFLEAVSKSENIQIVDDDGTSYALVNLSNKVVIDKNTYVSLMLSHMTK